MASSHIKVSYKESCISFGSEVQKKGENNQKLFSSYLYMYNVECCTDDHKIDVALLMLVKPGFWNTSGINYYIVYKQLNI